MPTSEPVALEQDRELLAAFRAGKRDVLSRVYRALVEDVFRLVSLGFVSTNGTIRGERDPGEQRAIIQDVFVKAFGERARLGYDGVRPYRPYLLTIARNVMIDRARARSSEQGRASDVDVDAIIAVDAPIPGAIEVSADEQRLRARAATYIETLTPELKRFVALRFEQELSQLDVAKELGITRRRVRTLEARVVTGLCRFLKK